MRISTKDRFAVTAMIDVALYQDLGPVPLSEIAQRHQISVSYLEQMFSKLRHAKLVESTRGPGGGYVLALPGEAISVAAIVTALEDAADERPEREGMRTQDRQPDTTRALWDSLNTKVNDYLQSISLHSLVQEQRSKIVVLPLERKTEVKGVFKKPEAPKAWRGVPNSVFALGQPRLSSV